METRRRWSIRQVPETVIAGFRTVAFESDCSIAELLEEAFHVWWEQCVTEEDEADGTE